MSQAGLNTVLVSETLLLSLIDDAKKILEDGNVSFGELVQLGASLAGKVNPIVHLSGTQKKELVLLVVQKALSKISSDCAGKIPAQDLDAYRLKLSLAADFVFQTLPDVLDVTVDAARGKWDLGKAKKSIWTLVKFGCKCLQAQLPEEPKKVLEALEKIVEDKIPVEATSVSVEESQEKSDTRPPVTIEKPDSQPSKETTPLPDSPSNKDTIESPVGVVEESQVSSMVLSTVVEEPEMNEKLH